MTSKAAVSLWSKSATSRTAAFCLLALGLLPACGGGVSNDGTSTDSAADTGVVVSDVAADVSETLLDGASGEAATDTMAETSDAGDAAPMCSDLVLSDPVTISAVAEAPPMLKGGSIVDGVYVVSSGVDYVGASGTPGGTSVVRRTVRFAGSAYDVVRRDDGGTEHRFSGTFAISGTSFLQKLTCPSKDSASAPYEASPTTFKIFVGGGPGTRLLVMTRK